MKRPVHNDVISKIIRLFQECLSFHKEIIDARHFLFYIILSIYVWSIL